MSSWREQFHPIVESIIASDGTNDFTNDKYSNTACGCQPKFAGELICRDSRCINFATQTECVRCKEGCCNRRIQNKEYAKLDVLHTPGKGHGLFAAENLTKQQFLMEYVGELINNEEFTRRSGDRSRQMEHQYIMQLKNGVYLDAGRKGSISRFINHSCEPNCYVEVWTVQNRLRVGIFTMCGIDSGTELTFDYKWKPSSRPPTKCHCGTESCRGYLEVFSREELEGLKVRRGLWRRGGEPVGRGGISPRPPSTTAPPLPLPTQEQQQQQEQQKGSVNVPVTTEWLIAPSPPPSDAQKDSGSGGGEDDGAATRSSSRQQGSHADEAIVTIGAEQRTSAADGAYAGDIYNVQGLLVPGRLIGRRVKVWWQGNLAYLEADVEAYNAKTNKYLCR